MCNAEMGIGANIRSNKSEFGEMCPNSLEHVLRTSPGVTSIEQTVSNGKRVWRAVGSGGGVSEGISPVQAIAFLKIMTGGNTPPDVFLRKESETTDTIGALVQALFAGKNTQYIMDMVENNLISLKRNWERNAREVRPWEAYVTYVNRKQVEADADGPARTRVEHQNYLLEGNTMPEVLGKGWLFARFGIHPDRDILGVDEHFIYLRPRVTNQELLEISLPHSGDTGPELRVSKDKLKEYIDQPGVPVDIGLYVSVEQIKDQINKKRLPTPLFEIPFIKEFENKGPVLV
jgi:hypothetical protein